MLRLAILTFAVSETVRLVVFISFAVILVDIILVVVALFPTARLFVIERFPHYKIIR